MQQLPQKSESVQLETRRETVSVVCVCVLSSDVTKAAVDKEWEVKQKNEYLGEVTPCVISASDGGEAVLPFEK